MNFILLLAFAFSSWASDLPYEDGSFACIDSNRAQKYVRDFSIDYRSFGGMELCDSTIDTKKLFNDLMIVEDGRFQPQGQNKLIRNFIPVDQYYTWLKGETRGISRGNDIPYATAYNSWGYFTMQDGWAALSALGRVGTVVHEARHTAGYRHYSCRQGSYQGSNLAGCDQTYDQAGSHAIEMEYYARVSVQGENFHPVYRSMARLMAMARANFVFNTPIIQKKEALLAIDSENRAHLYTDGTWVEREMPNLQGRLKRTSAGAVIFDGEKAMTLEMYENTGFKPDVRDDYSYFKLLAQGKGPWVDFEEFDMGPRRFVAGVDTQNQISIFNFPRGDWGPKLGTQMNVARMATLLENGDEGFFLVDQNADIKPFDPTTQRFGTTKGFKWASDLIAVAKVDGKIVTLRGPGQLFENRNNQWVPWTPAAGLTFTDLVNVPLYDAFEVVK